MTQVQYNNNFGGDLIQLQDMTFADEIQMMAGNAEMEPLPLPAPQEHIAVFVSGQTFYMLPSLFEQVQCLPWYQVGGLYHLDKEADLFEVVLQFFLTGALPSKALLKKRRESLYDLVAPLKNASELLMYVQYGKKKSSSSSPPMRGLSLCKSAETNKPSKGFFSFKSKIKMQSKSFDDLEDSQSITSGALSQVTQATTVTTMSTKSSQREPETCKSVKKGGWSILNRPTKAEVLDSLRSEYIV